MWGPQHKFFSILLISSQTFRFQIEHNLLSSVHPNFLCVLILLFSAFHALCQPSSLVLSVCPVRSSLLPIAVLFVCFFISGIPPYVFCHLFSFYTFSGPSCLCTVFYFLKINHFHQRIDFLVALFRILTFVNCCNFKVILNGDMIE